MMIIRIFGILSLVLLSACEPKRPEGDKTRNLSDFEKNSCAYGFDDGGRALDVVAYHEYSKTSFGMTFDRLQIEAIPGPSDTPPTVEKFSWGCGHLPTQEEFSHASW